MKDRQLPVKIDKINIVAVGEFNAGKSTLLNRLIGEPILPTDIFQTTATINFLQQGPNRSVAVHHEDRQVQNIRFEDLQEYNAENGDFDEINFIEVFHPDLPPDFVFIDTPGFNDPNPHREAMVRSILPTCDGILFISDAGQPLKSSEIPFLKSHYTQVLFKRTVFIFNHSDQLEYMKKLTDIRNYVEDELVNIFQGQSIVFKKESLTQEELREKIYFTCLDSEALGKCPLDLKKNFDMWFEDLKKHLTAQAAKKSVVIRDREKIKEVLTTQKTLEDTRRKIGLMETFAADQHKAVETISDNLYKQLNNITGFNQKIMEYRKQLKQHLDHCKEQGLNTIRANVNNRQILNAPYFVEIEIKKALQILLDEMVDGFSQLSKHLMAYAIQMGKDDVLNIENLNLNMGGLEDLNRTREDGGLDMMQTQLQAGALGVFAGILLAQVMGPMGFWVGTVGGQLLPATKIGDYKKELQCSIDAAVNKIVFQIEEVIASIYQHISEAEEKVIRHAKNQVCQSVLSRQWDLIQLRETMNATSGQSLDVLVRHRTQLESQIVMLMGQIGG